MRFHSCRVWTRVAQLTANSALPWCDLNGTYPPDLVAFVAPSASEFSARAGVQVLRSPTRTNGVTLISSSKYHTLVSNFRLPCALVFVLWMLPLSAAQAFSDPTYYGKYPTEVWGGGGGRFFTGSPADGYDCSVCHTSNPTYSFPLYQTGLPVDGYVTGTEYKIKLQWPEAAAYERSATNQPQLNLHPLSLITAEFVAEDGGSSGSLALVDEGMQVEGADTCARKPTDPASTLPLASRIFEATQNAETIEISDRKQVCSTSGDTPKRCVAAIRQCIPGPGATQLQFKWTSPPQWRGPIWFSAGFVFTYNADGIPNDADYVTTLSVPMNAKADGSTYETKLDGGCSVAQGQHAAGGSLWLFALGLACAGLFRRRRPQLWLAAACALAAAVSGCDRTDIINDKASVVGRFEPGVLIDGGFDAGKLVCMGTDIPEPENDAGREPGGNMTLTYTTTIPATVPMGYWDMNGLKPNFGVVWIEDDMGRFVKTVEFWGKVIYVAANLHDYLLKRVYCPVDVTAGATLYDYAQHMVTWDGKDSKGHVVPDGAYVLWIDVQIDERNPMLPYRIDFTKGRVPLTITPAPAPPQTGTTLTYSPN